MGKGDPNPTYIYTKRGSAWRRRSTPIIYPQGKDEEDFAIKKGYSSYAAGGRHPWLRDVYIMVFVKVIGSIDGKRFVVGKRLVRAFVISCHTSKACMKNLRRCYMNNKPKACKALVPKWKAIPNRQCKHFGFAMV